MLIFKKIRYKNFLSAGNDFLEIQLDKSPVTLIVGDNGSGKTSGIIDGLCFALYGKAFRKINKPQLVNTITNRDCLVEVEFSNGQHEYLVRRGIKPNIFEIHQNGVMLDQSADIGDDQGYLEKSILKMNLKTFSQIVVLGSTNYTPFMKLSAADRRLVVEDLLDLQVFSLMSASLKLRLDSAKSDLKTLEHELELTEQRIELLESSLASLKKNNDDIVDAKNKQIEEVKEQITYLEKLNSLLEAEVETLQAEVEDESKTNKKLKKLDDYEFELNQKIKTYRNETKFLTDNESCPTCTQEISTEFRKDRIENRTKKINKIEEGLTKLKEEYKDVLNRLNEISAINKTISTKNSEISSNLHQIRSQEILVQTLRKDIESLNNKSGDMEDIESNLSAARDSQETQTDSIFGAKEDIQVMEVAAKMLKDSGIKSRIIQQYVPIINSVVNSYLSQLDFFVQFELDEKFDETIKSRYRDVFSYGSFSEGEKMRIDLALMLTWREIAKRRNSAATNLLVMDEVADGPTDGDGIDNLLEIIEKMDEGSNVFVISHSEKMQDRIDNVIKFEKVKNFSRIV